MSAALEGISSVSALTVYRREIVPAARRGLKLSAEAAEAIPDPGLRQAAAAALRQKAGNVEAAAAVAVLAPRAQRAQVVRAIVSLQTAIDYLDTLDERPGTGSLDASLQLHRALEEAVSPDAGHSDWYRLYPEGEDGGYLASLIAACQHEIGQLPARDAICPTARRAARRCGEGQSHTHAAAEEGESGLREWAARLMEQPGYSWWELAAGASSSVAAHALIAAGGDPETTRREAELIEAAYFPPIGALTVLLDDLVDLEQDIAAGEHNYLVYYRRSDEAAERMTSIVGEARNATAKLRRRRTHDALLAGVAGFYLSQPPAKSEYARPIRARLLDCLGAPIYPVLAAMRFIGHA